MVNFKLKTWQRDYLLSCLFFFLIMLFCIPDQCHESDKWCWINWTNYVFNNGLCHVYDSGSDYLPLYLYILKLFTLTQSSVESIVANMKYLKLVTLIFHFISSYFVILIVKTQLEFAFKLKYIIFYLCNIAVLYNTILWGQVDEILTCFIIGSIYFSIKKNTLFASVFYLLALNFKLHAIIFLPILGLILLPEYWVKKKKIILFELTILMIIQLAILAPFHFGNGLGKLYLAIFTSVDRYPVLSMNAFNFWHLFFQNNTISIMDNMPFWGLSYKKIGLLLFFTTSLIALLPHIKYCYFKIFKSQNVQLNINALMITCTLIPCLFFYFNTQMHERYCHPAIIFSVIFCILNRKYLVGFLLSLAYLQNLDAVLKSLRFQNYGVLIYNNVFISILFLMSILLLFFELNKIKIHNLKS